MLIEKVKKFNRVGTVVNQYSAVWLNSTVRFCIYTAVSLKIRPFSFLFIQQSGFGRMDKFALIAFIVSYTFTFNSRPTSISAGVFIFKSL